MALVVEDGTGLATANSYVAVADADAYFADRSVPASWPATDADKAKLLIKATDYVDRVFGPRFRGSIYVSTQRLLWPRYDVEDSAGRVIPSSGAGSIPRPLTEAVIIAAGRAASDPLFLTGAEGESGGRIKKQSTKLGDLEVSEEFETFSADDLVANGVRKIPEVEEAIAPILVTAGAAVDWAYRT